MCWLHRRATGALVVLHPTELSKESPHYFLLPAIVELPFLGEELWAGEPIMGQGVPHPMWETSTAEMHLAEFTLSP